MKKRIVVKAFALCLSFAIAVGGLQTQVQAQYSVSFNGIIGDGIIGREGDGMQEAVFMPMSTEDQEVFSETLAPEICGGESKEQTVAEEKTAEPDAITDAEEKEPEYPLVSRLDLFSLNWKEEPDSVLNHYFGMTEWKEIGNWLSSLSEKDFEEVLDRDTVLVQETEILPAGSDTAVSMLYYEYALRQYRDSMMTRATYPATASGYWQTHIIKTNAVGTPVKKAVITHKISGIDTTVPTTERQSVTVAKSVTSNWCDIVWESEKEEFNTYKEQEGNAAYPLVKAYMNFQKPTGYDVSVSYNLDSGFRKMYWNPTMTFGSDKSLFVSGGTISEERKEYPGLVTYNNVSTAPLRASEFAGRHYICCIVNMYVNAGVGTTGTPANGNLVQTITLSPVNYNVSYNGNGATSGAVSAQACTYDVNYLTQTNGYARDYTVTYNGNVGTPEVSSQKSTYVFKGWGLNQKNTVNYSAGNTYTNLTAVKGAAVTMYAIWQPISVKLPSATRTGYQFAGWNIGMAGATYTPSANVTATAKWTPNKYKIAFRSAGGTQCDEINATYDQSIILPTPVRSGYSFNGWRSDAGIHVGNVKNLTKENGVTITLTADWTANTSTPYKIRYYKQPSRGEQNKANYVLFEPEKGDKLEGERILYGTTDAMVTVAADRVEGYVTPASQTVQIDGDGSTCICFYYNLESEQTQVVSPVLGASDSQLEEIARKIAAGLSFSMDIDGAKYEIVQKEDGTLGIEFISTNESKVVVPDIVTIGGKVYRITEINSKAFKGNTAIKEVQLSANISKIGDSAFEGCSLLTKVTLREGLVTIGKKAFLNCVSLKSIKLPSTVQSIGDYAFQNCKKMSKVTLNTGLTKIGKRAFYGCISLTKVTIPKTVLKIGSYAFAKCGKLKKISFASESGLLTIGTGVFSRCSALTSIKLPFKLTNISSKAFYGCKKLSSVTGAGAVTKIGTSAFENCTKLSKITIPSKVQTIGKKAFYNCKSLKKVTIKSKAITSVGAKAFKKCKKGITFVVPKSKKSSYSRMFRGKY